MEPNRADLNNTQEGLQHGIGNGGDMHIFSSPPRSSSSAQKQQLLPVYASAQVEIDYVVLTRGLFLQWHMGLGKTRFSTSRHVTTIPASDLALSSACLFRSSTLSSLGWGFAYGCPISMPVHPITRRIHVEPNTAMPDHAPPAPSQLQSLSHTLTALRPYEHATIISCMAQPPSRRRNAGKGE